MLDALHVFIHLGAARAQIVATVAQAAEDVLAVFVETPLGLLQSVLDMNDLLQAVAVRARGVLRALLELRAVMSVPTQLACPVPASALVIRRH